MSTISDVNIVIQQGGSAKQTQKVQHPTQDFSQVVAGQQKEKDSEQRTTVQQADDSEKPKLDKDPSGRRKRDRRAERKKKKAGSGKKKDAETSGKLLDTIA